MQACVIPDPEHPGLDMKPSSFVIGWSQLLFLGEHGIGEPGARAPDSAYRRSMSADFVAEKYDNYLIGMWWPKCICEFRKKYKK